MKQVISGTLARAPELRTYPDRETGEARQVSNLTLFVFDPAAPEGARADGTTYKKSIPLQCVAWGDLARQVSGFQKGDTVTASTTMRYRERVLENGIHIPEPLYVIRRIDPANDIQKQMSRLLTGYEKGDYDRLDGKEQQPDFSPDRQSEQQRERKQEPSQEQETGKARE